MYEPTLKENVRRFRHKGYTFREILKKFPFFSKGTISRWTRDIVLTSEQEKRILNKQLKGRIELMECNKQRQIKAAKNAQKIISKAKKEIGKLTKKDLLIAGTALYWAEGWTKSRNRNTIDITNSDPKVIALMMRFFREILEIKESQFRGALTLHPGLDEKEALEFWSSLTKVPLNQFNKTYTKPPKSTTRKMHNILYKGTLKIRISDTNKLWRLKGFIRALS